VNSLPQTYSGANNENQMKAGRKQTHLSFFDSINTETPLSEQMDTLTERLCEFAQIQ